MIISLLGVVVAVLIGLLLYLAYRSIVRPENYPPGPVGIPILGSLYLLKEYSERDMLELAKKYGNIFSLQIVAQKFVCVCGTEANREVLFNENICDRYATYVVDHFKGRGSLGPVHGDYGEMVKSHRALGHSVIANVGVLNNTDDLVRKETGKMMAKLEKLFESEKPEFIRNVVEIGWMNVLISFIFGSKDERTPEENNKIENVFYSLITIQTYASEKLFRIPALVPGLDKIWMPESAKKFIELSNKICDYGMDQVESHKKDFDPNNLRDLIDCYLKKMQDKELTFNEANLRSLIYDLFIGGTETSARTLEYALYHLAANHDVQEKLLDEILNVVGSAGDVTYDDRSKMPYTNATMHEILRSTTMFPTGVPRRASKDVTVCGYTIPKGTVFLMNTYSSNKQDDKWKNATTFDPGNFLNEEGEFTNNKAFILFGGGVRKCLGALLLKKLIFVFLVKIVQKFRVMPETDESEINLEPKPGLLRVPESQKLRLLIRQ